MLLIFSSKALLLHKNQLVMTISALKKTVLAVGLGFTTIAEIDAQKKQLALYHDQTIENLLHEKRKINGSLAINDQYKIQIFSGTSELAKKTLTDYKLTNKNMDATIVFQTPNYKVWVGNFRSRMEAERNLLEIKRKYNNVLLIKPSK
ncbi:MAG: SPOR domain-containing protein [Flavobacterium sp.]